MPVDVDFPDDLPCVSRIDGYQATSASAVIRTPFEAGNSRQRRLHARMPTEIALAWRVSNAQLHPLFSWLNEFGYDWFNLTLAGIEASQAGVESMPIAVRCMGDIQTSLMQFHRANWWTLRVAAEYQPPVDVLTPAIVEGFAMMYVPLHRVTPDPEYGELVYVNLDAGLSMGRNVSDTGTRLRGQIVDPTTMAVTQQVRSIPRRKLVPRVGDVPLINYEWTLDAQVTAGPGGGRMRLNNAAQALASLVWINYTTADSVDTKNLMTTLDAGSEIYIQDKADSARWARYQVTAPPIDQTTYMEFATLCLASGAQVTQGRLIVLIYQEGTAPEPERQENLIEVIVKETPEEIAALARQQSGGFTRRVGAPRTSPLRPV
jgi:hypothetical protein